MLSGHFPMFYSGVNPAIMLIAIFVTTVLIRHYFNLRGEGKKGGAIVITIVTVLTAITFIALMPTKPKIDKNAKPVAFEKVSTIIQNRCDILHSATPSDDVFTIAPSGFILDTKDQIVHAKDVIYSRAIVSDSMPLGNKTHMTKEERDLLAQWIISQK